MDKLPDEVILHVLSYLDIIDIVRFQAISSRYLSLARDKTLWKLECFNHSQAEALRRRQQLRNVQDPRLNELVNAVSAWPGSNLTSPDIAQLRESQEPQASSTPESEEKRLRSRALANWEPGYPEEKLDYYEEYIQRHAEINVDWIDLPNGKTDDQAGPREATGVGTLTYDGASGNHLVAPIDDGSVCIWDITARSTTRSGGSGRLLGQSQRGILTGRSDATQSHTIMTETGAVECVSIDSQRHKGYFAVQNALQEVDLRTLQLASTKHYPFPITALSPCQLDIPLAVGTNHTIHLYDPRDATPSPAGPSSGELIAGPTASHATLSQPGPLSILSHASTSSLWVAGRFTSLLNYDVRHFPRLLRTLHSGARIASLTSLPNPLLPRSLDLLRNPSVSLSSFQSARATPGTTLLAAAEYKGKGSLELYGLPANSSPQFSPPTLQNRQTASASKLLSAAPHAGRLVFSDGDGNVRWFERDALTHVRTWNVNAALPACQPSAGDDSMGGIWSSSASEMPGQGDIVQKLLPLPSPMPSCSDLGRPDLPAQPLGLWTGDGRLGVLGFGPNSPLGKEGKWHDAVEVQALSAGERAREDAERQFGRAMRRALERNADEVRFVRGLGMG